MKENTKVLIAVLIVFIFVCLGIFVAYVFIPKQDKLINLDLQELKTEIENTGKYNEIASTDITKDNIEEIFNIKKEDVEEVIGKSPLVEIKSSMYAIVKVKDGMQEYIKEKFEVYSKEKEKQWESFLAEQYDLVKNRKIGIVGNYVYIIVSSSADDIEKLIK